MTSASVEASLFDLLKVKEPGKSIGPEEVAKLVDAEAWRRVLPQVRSTAIGLARQGRLVITRHGKAADPNQFRGVYRLRLPIPGEDLPGLSSLTNDLDVTKEETP